MDFFFIIFFLFVYFVEIFGFFSFFGICFQVTKVTTQSYQVYYWAPKIAKNRPKQNNKLLFFGQWATKASVKGQSHPQELEVGPHSGLYLLVDSKNSKYKSGISNILNKLLHF